MDQKSITWLDAVDAVTMPDHERIAQQWIETYAKIHKVSKEDAEVIHKRESIYWKKAVSTDEKLQSCGKLSLYSVLIELAVNGLSLQPGSKSECFLEARGVRIGGTRENPVHTNACFLKITAYGELNLRIASGQIIRMRNPVVVYEGDHFQPKTDPRGRLVVDYQPLIPRKSKKIIGCWVCIELPGNSLDFKWLLEDDIERLRKFSIPRYTGAQANALYTSENGGIDPGFLEAKTIKHAMRAYTKLRIGDSAVMDDEPDTETPEDQEPFGSPIENNEDTVNFNINEKEPF